MSLRPPTPRTKLTAWRWVAAAAACAALALSLSLAGAPGPEPAQTDVQSCRAACQALGSRLIAALGKALKEGGPAGAIGVCRDQAPALAAEVSKETGCTIRRTSLKIRNPKNAPDAWERHVLDTFAREAALGKDPASLEYAEVVHEEGVPVLRYMKAITVGEPCLACHGQSLAPAVSAALSASYPGDKATGYKKGGLRGAFSVSKTLAASP